jgi:cation transporter-like permease
LPDTATAPLGSRRAHLEASAQDKRARRFLLRLSLANWGVAVVAWTISAFLGITSPASIIVYTVLFVIGLFAVIVAIVSYLLEKFAHRPAEWTPDGSAEHVEPDDAVEAVEAVEPAETRMGPGGRPLL